LSALVIVSLAARAFVARPIALVSSRAHSTERVTSPQRSQLPGARAVVENACCRNGVETTATCSTSDTATPAGAAAS
jgi:hypothetical protein